MTVAQTNQSLLKTTNRQLQLELAQCKVYISELEQQLEKAQTQNTELNQELEESQAQNAKLSPVYDKAKNAFEDPELKEQKVSEVFTEEDFQ